MLDPVLDPNVEMPEDTYRRGLSEPEPEDPPCCTGPPDTDPGPPGG
jgi:hypothetical protein